MSICVLLLRISTMYYYVHVECPYNIDIDEKLSQKLNALTIELLRDAGRNQCVILSS